MKKIVKQVLGIDVAQKELVVCLARLNEDLSVDYVARRVFVNTRKGFDELTTWVKKHSDSSTAVQYVMEATGVYHEAIAYYLSDAKQRVSIVLPKKISHYIKTLEIKTITDRTAAEAIAQFGLERNIDEWKRPHPSFKTLRQLTRERQQVIDERTLVKNQLHAELVEYEPNASTISRLKKRVAFLDKQQKEITKEITDASKVVELRRPFEVLQSVPGVGMLTAASILAETNAFHLIRNKKQLVSYAGLDVREKQSGTSVRGKRKISKTGNRYLRKSLHFPALCAIRHNKRFDLFYNRLYAKHGIKMKAIVAVQRKILELTYILFKTDRVYDANYLIAPEFEERKPLTGARPSQASVNAALVN
jgi:transposase